MCLFFFFQAEDGIRDLIVTGVQTCALPICSGARSARAITYHRGAAGGGRLRDGAGAASRRGRGRMINALAVEGLSHNFGGLQALSDVSLHAAAGERLVIVGPNGAGKTTLFNIVTGLISPNRSGRSPRGRASCCSTSRRPACLRPRPPRWPPWSSASRAT